MKTSFLKIVLLLVLLFITTPVLNSKAQTTVSENTNLSISINPQNPAPGDQVTLTLQSFSLDLNRSKITWFVNEAEKQSGIGTKTYYIRAGDAGLVTTITAQVEDANGELITRNISFTPAGIDLIFESVSYVPPFYKGRAMNVSQGTVVVVAFPEIFDSVGRKFNTNELVYTWRKDGIVVAEASGAGKNYLTFTGSIPAKDVEISVTASALNQNITADNSVLITNGSPKIIFYENSPVYGIMMNRAIKNTVQMFTDEFGVVAMPYFYSAGFGASGNLDYAWTLNGRTIENQEPKNHFTARQETKGSGSANIGLRISNNSRIFQFSDKQFTINFEKN